MIKTNLDQRLDNQSFEKFGANWKGEELTDKTHSPLPLLQLEMTTSLHFATLKACAQVRQMYSHDV